MGRMEAPDAEILDSELVQTYLNTATRRLVRLERRCVAGMLPTHASAMRTAVAAFATVSPSSAESLRVALDAFKVRRQVRPKVQEVNNSYNRMEVIVVEGNSYSF